MRGNEKGSRIQNGCDTELTLISAQDQLSKNSFYPFTIKNFRWYIRHYYHSEDDIPRGPIAMSSVTAVLAVLNASVNVIMILASQLIRLDP